MKKMLNLLLVFALMIFASVKVSALTFEEAFNQADRKPMVVLIYAQWADGYQTTLQQYRTVKAQMGNKFNFVELDIASKDTKSFNSRYHIYPNLPYILMFRDGGRVSRYIQRSCAADAACTTSKLKSFIQ